MKETKRSDPFDFNGALSAPRDNPGQLTVDRATLENLLRRAETAAQLVGHLDNAQPELIGRISDHVDTIAHELAEILSAPSALQSSTRDPRTDLVSRSWRGHA